MEVKEHVEDLLSKNKTTREIRSFLGGGVLDIYIPAAQDELLTEQKRLFVKLVTGILYQGTGIWISVHSENIGTNLIAIDFSTADAPIETQIFNLRVVKNIKFYLQSWGPKIFASLGIFLPILRALLGL